MGIMTTKQAEDEKEMELDLMLAEYEFNYQKMKSGKYVDEFQSLSKRNEELSHLIRKAKGLER